MPIKKLQEVIPKEKRCLAPCENCPFGGPDVGSRGDPNSPIVIIGESPGRQESQYGSPFIGPSGKVLESALAKFKADGIDPYIINAMQCNPGYGDDKDEERMVGGVAACRNRVLADIARAPRSIILALGTPALWSITNNFNLKITQERGKLLPTELASIGLVPSVHPAFLMRGGTGGTYQQFMRDVEYAISLALRKTTPKKPPDVEWRVLETPDDVRDLAKYFRSLPKDHPIGADVETTGFSFIKNEMLCAGYAPTPELVHVIPRKLILHQDILFDNSACFVWHNGKFDIKFLWRAGIRRARLDADTMLMSYAIDENGGIHDLEQVASDWLGSPNWKSVLDQYLPDRKTSYEAIPTPILHKYMALDIGNTRALYSTLADRISRDPMSKRLVTRTLFPASTFLARVETNGLFVDLDRVSENEKSYGGQVDDLKAQIMEYAKPFPDSGYTDKLPGSHVQMNRLIYDDLGIKKYKGKRGTAAKVIEKLPPHPFLTLLSKMRKVGKEYSTYVKPAREKVESSGAIHTTLKLHATVTGRLASEKPNLQNIPRNPQVRGQFIAKPGTRFVEPDLNQAELRILACSSNDAGLCHIYETAGMSLHEEMRSFIWGTAKDWSNAQVQEYLRKFALTEETRYGAKGEDRIVEEQKMRAKAVNFGIPYGREAGSIAEEFNINATEAQGWIDAWFKKFPQAKDFLDKCRQAPIQGWVLCTPFGNRRRFGVVANELLKTMQNQATNFSCQGPASHITLHAGMATQDYLAETYDAHYVNLVHDSLLNQCPDDDLIAAQVAKIIIDKMEELPAKWGFTRIPFVAEAKMGYRWGSLSKFDPEKFFADRGSTLT